MADISAIMDTISHLLLPARNNAKCPNAVENCSETEESLLQVLGTLCVFFSTPVRPKRTQVADEVCRLGLPHACSVILQSYRNDDFVLFQTFMTLKMFADCGTLPSHATALVDAQCHRHMVELLTHGNVTVMAQAAQAVGTLVSNDGYGITMRDIILSTRCANGNCVFLQLDKMYSATIASLEKEEERRSWQDLVGWVLSVLCHGVPQPTLLSLLQSFPLLERILCEATPRSNGSLNAVRAVKNICWGTSDDRVLTVIKHGLMNACLNALVVLPHKSQLMTRTQREHNYMQDTCALPTEQLADVFAFVGTSSMKKISFGCKDWFYDIVCRDGYLYHRLSRSEAMQLDGAFEGSVLRLLAMSVSSEERRREAVHQPLVFDAIERLAITTGAAGEKRTPEYRKELLFVIGNATANSKERVDLVLARPQVVNFVIAALQTDDDAGVVANAALIVHNAVQCVDDIANLVRNGWIHGLLVATKCVDATLKEIIISALEIFSEHVALEQHQTDDHDAASPSTVALLDGGIDVWLELVAEGPEDNDFIRQAMTKFPEAFCSARSYYYAMLLPFGLVAWFINGQHHQLMVRGAAELLRDAVSRRAQDLDALRNKMIKNSQSEGENEASAEYEHEGTS